MHNEGAPTPAAAPAPAPPSGLLHEIAQLGHAVKRLFGAQMELLAAEFGLARSAISWMLIAGLAATVVGVGFGLTVLGLIGVVLAKWLGSWIWALLALALLQLLLLTIAIVLFRRCMHWMSMPETRAEWGAMIRSGGREIGAELQREVAAGTAAAERTREDPG